MPQKWMKGAAQIGEAIGLRFQVVEREVGGGRGGNAEAELGELAALVIGKAELGSRLATAASRPGSFK